MMDNATPGSIRVWNLHDGVTAMAGAQQRLNVVGRVENPAETSALHARLNDGEWMPVPVNLTDGSKARLCAPGDFNLDGIDVDDLDPTNVLVFRQTMRDGSEELQKLSFDVVKTPPEPQAFDLALRPGEIEEFCQVVDGAWALVHDEDGLAIGMPAEFAGYDRIVLFGDRRWTTGYEVEACLTVDAWTHYVHNIGLLFKWNMHGTATGTTLPNVWSTGLAYYASTTPGLRLRFGVDVRWVDGERTGDFVLKEVPRARWSRIPVWLHRAAWYLSGRRVVLSQLRTGVRYRFRARIDPDIYSLTVWRDDRPRPARPQVVVERPIEQLPTGAVGIIAQNASARLHEFSVRPLA